MRRVALFSVLAVFASACGGSSGETTTTAAPTTTVAVTTTAAQATTTTEAAPPMRPVTPVRAPLEATYHTAGEFDPAVMGFDVGDVTAEWFQSDGFYVVVYSGYDHDAAGPLCPGASIVLTGREGFFDFVANAPSPGADCSGFPTLSEDPDVRALVCDGQLAFRTAIPSGSEGTLYGTLEKPDAGGIIGATGIASTDMGAIPEIDQATLEC